MKKLILILALMGTCVEGIAQDKSTLLTKSYQQSAFSLFNAVAKQEADNICFSPLSVQLALSMVQNGAAGNTLDQLQTALGTMGFTNEEIGSFNAQLTKKLCERPFDIDFIAEEAEGRGIDPQELYEACFPCCELANSLWTRPDVQLYETFLEALRNDYDAGMDAVYFDTWEGIEKINGWINEHTHGLIPMVFNEPQSEDLALVLINTLYFKGGWRVQFSPENTSQGQFQLDDGTYTKVDMMFARDRFDCAITPTFQTITLYYGSEYDFSMTVFVPLEGTALPPLTFDDWSAAQRPKYMHINLYMPRFQIAQRRYELIDVLKSLGVKDAFSVNANFTRMCNTKRAIDQIYQLSRIIVDEKGTEAAAATIIQEADGMDFTRPEDYQDFKVDRPFYFTIQSRKTGAILFAGRVKHLDGPKGQVDAITSLPTETVNSKSINGQWYDLSGRRISVPSVLPKGVYIKDGKKVVVK